MKIKKINKLYVFGVTSLVIVAILSENFYVDKAFAITDEEQEQVDDKKDEIKELDEKAAVYEKIIKLKQEQESLLSQKINSLNSEIAETKENIDSNIETISKLNQQVKSLEGDIFKNEELLELQRDLLSKILRSYYESDTGIYAKILLGINTFSGFALGRDHLSQTGDKITEITVNLKALQEELENKKSKLVDNKNELIDERDSLEAENARLNSNKIEKSSILIQTQGDEKKYKTKLAEVEAKRKEIEEGIEVIEGVKSSNVDYSKLPPIKKGYFTYPVNPVIITQGYGRTSFSYHYYSGYHNGIDFGTNQRYISIYAAKSGKILATGDNGKYAYGKWIAVNHDDGLVTLYGHLSKISVSKGEKVKEGGKIGISGNTGFSTGPHLHFSVFAENTFELKNLSGISSIPTGGSVDPNRYLK
jgi:murein DD-endopeptidase MepM/ murein hydrolase activator NlpD